MKSTKAVRAARRPMLRAAGLTPLLLSMAIYNAYAADVTKVGAKGLDGVDATMPYEAGTAGAAAPVSPTSSAATPTRSTAWR